MEKREIVLKETLTVIIDTHETVTILTLKGFIDSYNTNNFKDLIVDLIEKGSINILFDCTELTYVSSSGIGAFVFLIKFAREKKGNIVIVKLQPKVFEIFKLLKIDQAVKIVKKLDQGLELFNVSKDSVTGTGSVFPREFNCPGCSKSLKVFNPGRFRCSQCKTVIVVDEGGEVGTG
jgi:anti-sigma B factor antagonist